MLVVEDHQDIRNLVALHLRDMDCQVTMAQDGAGGLAHAKNQPYDLIVLDWMLPGISGIDICREARRCGNHSPILMLTARSMENERIHGLDTGVDDYMTKPFSIPEFLARVRAIFRRNDALYEAGQPNREGVLHLKDLSIDGDQRLVHLSEKPIDLTAKEFDLLRYLARHPGQVFTRQQLLDAVWGNGFDGYEHTVNSHINRLRAKIEKNHGEPEYIVTVWGVGYRMPDFRCH
ncbi:response regulator transcription factor [Noviherbaspirillum sp. CPCC 100848]|uniref:Response regulator transcription factor n=1 Tax=Noviherbaspirillum album TaxID=3080276 RepID=A0ABU6J378_9BURK|nr:response regulator transcription factor [Noviherbaspirillum sp. CPCC 100848]MEC4718067.1 response regulator transcription factor [Noviherbaspirillum sp. CPCC 100848]